MSRGAVLELVHELLSDHDAGPLAVGLRIIPCVDEDLERDFDVVEAILRRFDAAAIDTARIPDARVTGTLDPILVERIQSLLAGAGLPVPELTQDGDFVQARDAGGGYPENPSHQEVLRVCSALFAEQFQGREVGLLAWRESEMDVLTRRGVWRLLSPPLQRVGQLTTLIAVSEGPVRGDTHFGTATNVRYAIVGDRLAKRKGAADLDAAVGWLLADTEHPLVLFLGAGASASSDLGLASDLRDFALQAFFAGAEYTESEAAVRFFEWVRANNRLLESETDISEERFVKDLTLERVLREEFRRIGDRESSPTLGYFREQNASALDRDPLGRRALKHLVERQPRLVLITVNFDTLLEHDLGDAVTRLATADELDRAPEVINRYLTEGGAIPLLKVHGTIEDPQSIVADVESTALGLPASVDQALTVLLERGAEAPLRWVYVGYSMRDPDLNERLGSAFFTERTEEMWIAPLLSPFVQAFANTNREVRWRDAGGRPLWERVVTERGDQFLTRLAERWPEG